MNVFSHCRKIGIVSTLAGVLLLAALPARAGFDGFFPTNGPTQGGINITSVGTVFGSSVGTVTIGGKSSFVTSWSNTKIISSLPAGQGTNFAVIVVSPISGTLTATQRFDYQPPIILGFSPSTASTAGGTLLTITGTNFGIEGQVFLESTTMATSSWSHAQIKCIVPAGQGRNLKVRVVTSGQENFSTNFSYASPVLSGLSPTHGPTGGGTLVTINGQDFSTNGSVILGGSVGPNLLVQGGIECVTTNWTQTSVQFFTPPGQSLGWPVRMTVAGQTSIQSGVFDYDPPRVDAFSPPAGPTAGGTLLTISGDNFGTNGTVMLGGIPCTNSTWSHKLITCQTPPGQGTVKLLQVIAGGQSGNATTFFNYNAPVISTVTPTNLPTIGGAQLAISGNNFGTNATVAIGSTACVISTQTHSTIVCTSPAGQGTGQILSVSVDGRLSNLQTVSYLPPTIFSLSTSNGPTAGGTPLTITGTNFGISGIVLLNGNLCSLTGSGWSQTAIQVLTPAGQGTNLVLRVTVSGQSATNTSFSYAPPILFSANPSSGPTAGGISVTLTGTNLGTSGQVTLGSNNVTASFWNSSTIIFSLPSGVGAGQLLRVTAGGQTSNPLLFDYLIPSLRIGFTNDNLLLSWPSNATDYLLEQSAVLNVSSSWNAVTPPYSRATTNFINVQPPTNSGQFFRLRRN